MKTFKTSDLHGIFPNEFCIIIDTDDFKNTFIKNSILYSQILQIGKFKPNWSGYYLYKFEDTWFPVKLEKSDSKNIFHITSIHDRLSKRVILRNQKLDVICPVIMHEFSYIG